MDKNCLNCYNFNDATSKCKEMISPPKELFCFVPDKVERLEQERACMKYCADHGNPHEIKAEAHILARLIERA